MNKTILVGRLTADPELRRTQNDKLTCKFTVAVDRKVAKDSEKAADFITCVAWNKTAEFVARYFTKGKQIALTGALRTGKYRDKNHDDVTHYTTEVWVDDAEFVGSKNDGGNAPAQTQEAQEQPTNNKNEYTEILGDDETPF